MIFTIFRASMVSLMEDYKMNFDAAVDKHKQFIIGDTRCNTIFEIYGGEIAKELRIRHTVEFILPPNHQLL